MGKNVNLVATALCALAALLAPTCASRADARLTTAPIIDPAFGVKAFTITIPAGWQFQGTVVPGPDCAPIPSPVFRAYASDGLSEIRLVPTFAWAFHSGTAKRRTNGCLEYDHPLTAADFLKHYEEMITVDGLHQVETMPIAPIYARRVAAVQHNMSQLPGVTASADAAAVKIETSNGSFVIEQRLRAYVECRLRAAGPQGPAGGVCTAHVDVVRAPKGRLEPLLELVDAHDLVRTPHEDGWLRRVLATQQAEGAHQMEMLKSQEQAGNSMLRRQHEQFMTSMQHNHDAFMQQQESSFRSHQAAMAQQSASFHSSMNNANQAMNARSTAASDWVDYSLDQQTVTGSGGTVKVSSAYGQTWSNGQGQWYQTNDPNANPNGSLAGNWTQDTRVHGNGTPR